MGEMLTERDERAICRGERRLAAWHGQIRVREEYQATVPDWVVGGGYERLDDDVGDPRETIGIGS